MESVIQPPVITLQFKCRLDSQCTAYIWIAERRHPCKKKQKKNDFNDTSKGRFTQSFFKDSISHFSETENLSAVSTLITAIS
jgi:hypothetical protein